MSMQGIPLDPNIQVSQDIPYAKSFPSRSQSLPVIAPRAPTPQNPFDAAYNESNYAQNLIQSRINKLNQEKNMLHQVKETYNPYIGDVASLANLRTLGNAKGQLANPNLYSHTFMDPIYYPLEMPISAEPVTLPKIEMGHPMAKKKKDCCLGIEDLLALLAMMRKNIIVPPTQQPQIVYQPPPDIGPAKRPIYDREWKKIPKFPTPKRPKKKEPMRMKRDWWRLCRDFVNLYVFFSSGRKYSQFAKVRNNMISNRTKAVVQELSVLKEWIISIEDSFWEEFKVFRDLDVSFKNIDSKLKIQRESQKIITFIKKYLENLIGNSTKLTDIPERIQKILYDYIRERAYYPKKFLSTYQINRIDFHFYGGSKNINEDRQAMIVAILLISCASVQQILLHMKEVFVEFQNYPNIDISAKYIGSILHYLVRDTFNNNPTMLREFLALLNFYRNYHIYNEQVEKQDDVFNNNMVFIDNDEYAKSLVPENNITRFWDLNTEDCENFKNYIYSWANRLAKLIKLKFQKNDPNLQIKRNLIYPQDKTVSYEIKQGPLKKIGEEVIYDRVREGYEYE